MAEPVSDAGSGWRESLLHRLFAPVDIAVLVYFRMAFGAMMLWEVWRYYDKGWTYRYWVEKPYHYKYYGFEWVKAAPGEWPHYLWILLAIPAAMIMAGLFYRVAATLFFLGFSYFFLLEQSTYQNHFYLVCLISFLAILVPAHRNCSLDVVMRPGIRRDTAPAWTLWMLRGQFTVLYFFGAVAKWNGDWMQGQPMRQWLLDRVVRVEHFPWAAAFFESTMAPFFFSWGGMLLDLLIVPALLWKRTRVLALIVLVGFHLMNSWLFPIGIFPWFCIAMAFLFCDPSWPRVIWGKISGETGKVVSAGGAEGAPSVWGRRTVLLFLMLWFTWQTLFPLRHFLYPGHVLWTDEGHRFAWQMRLRLKQGDIKFFKIDPVLETPVLVDLTEFIERHQYSSMRYRPEMILQTAQWIADRVESEGYARPEVNVMALARLNGRPAEVLIDPRVDLAKEKRDPGHVEWVMPMTEAMPRWWKGEGELESR